MERKELRKQGYKIKPYTSFRLLLIKTRNMRLTYQLPQTNYVLLTITHTKSSHQEILFLISGAFEGC